MKLTQITTVTEKELVKLLWKTLEEKPIMGIYSTRKRGQEGTTTLAEPISRHGWYTKEDAEFYIRFIVCSNMSVEDILIPFFLLVIEAITSNEDNDFMDFFRN